MTGLIVPSFSHILAAEQRLYTRERIGWVSFRQFGLTSLSRCGKGCLSVTVKICLKMALWVLGVFVIFGPVSGWLSRRWQKGGEV